MAIRTQIFRLIEKCVTINRLALIRSVNVTTLVTHSEKNANYFVGTTKQKINLIYGSIVIVSNFTISEEDLNIPFP